MAAKLTLLDRGQHTTKEYLRFFPSINATFNLSEDLVARAGYYGSNYKTWASRFPGTPAVETTPESPAPNILIASPLSPLPVGEGWVVSLLKGLPNTSASARNSGASVTPSGEGERSRQ